MCCRVGFDKVGGAGLFFWLCRHGRHLGRNSKLVEAIHQWGGMSETCTAAFWITCRDRMAHRSSVPVAQSQVDKGPIKWPPC